MDILPNISVPPRQWVNIYQAVGIPVGTRIIVQNVGVCDLHLSTQATQPLPTERAFYVLKRARSAINDAGDAGAWVFCFSGGSLNVRTL